MKTSKELSEKLKKAGFNKESELHHIRYSDNPLGEQDWQLSNHKRCDLHLEYIPAYDILNDLCCKYREEVWGKDTDRYFHSMRHHTNTILKFIQTNKPQKAIEDYLVANSQLFK